MAPKRNYSKEQMAKAIEAVEKGEKVGAAAAKYCVPRITLRNKVTGKSPIDCNFGPATVLTEEEENALVKWLFRMSDCHFPVTKDHLLDSVQKIILEKKLESCPFKENRPGKKWFGSFLKRHPEISERAAQNLTKARDDVTEEDLREWYASITKYMTQKGLIDVLNDPTRIFNADESAFYLQPKAGSVLVRKGEKNVYQSGGDEKENLTVLLTANAAGTLAPPMVVFPYERLPTLITNSVPDGWGIGRSETGWMCARTFYEYVTNVFNPWLEKQNVAKPIVFFLDGHRSHMTLHLAEFCTANGIEVIALYPNATHVMQPMDVAVFRPLKVFWKNQVCQWKMEHPGQRMKKEDFAPNLQKAVHKVTEDTLKNGFRKSGLYPFNIDYVDLDKLKSNPVSQSTTHTAKETENTNFLSHLEKEIKNIFSPQKLALFNQLYYLSRAELEHVIPDEDQSLFIIWAQAKNNMHTCSEEISTAPQTGNHTEKQPQPTLGSGAITSPQQEKKQKQQDLSSVNLQPTSGSEAKNSPQQEGTVSQQQPTPRTRDSPQHESQESQHNLSYLQTDIDLSTSMRFEKSPSPEQQHSMHVVPSSRSCLPSNEIIPSPFKRALFWPEPEVKKRRTKERIPSAITSDCWKEYMAKKENQKKEIQENKLKRMRERQEKKALKEILMKEKKEKAEMKKKQVKKGKNTKKSINSSSSEEADSEIEYQESEYDVNDEYDNEEEQDTLHEDQATTSNIRKSSLSRCGTEAGPSNRIQRNGYVIITYEGERFPGIIENTDKNYVEVSTMTLSKGGTFRWPDIPDKLWYKIDDIVEYIENPIPINKRGFFKVPEMGKYLPFIS